MYKGKKILAIVPARGGSKGLPGKNIRPLLGKPLIGWSIEQAKASQYIDRIYISTDSQEIADTAKSYLEGQAIELRPPELATDTAPSSAFIAYTINKLKNEGETFDYIILLEPTSPLRDVDDIDHSIEMLLNHPVAESLLSVVRAEDANPSFMVTISDNGLMQPYLADTVGGMRRQDINDVYYFEGTVYISKCSTFLEKRTFLHKKTLSYVVPKWKSFEIDDMTDFIIIEALMREKMNGTFSKHN